MISNNLANEIAYLVLFASRHFDIDYDILVALTQVESGFVVNVKGKAGELGLTQIMPTTFAEYSRGSLDNWRDLFIVSIEHLAKLKSIANGDQEWILAAITPDII